MHDLRAHSHIHNACHGSYTDHVQIKSELKRRRLINSNKSRPLFNCDCCWVLLLLHGGYFYKASRRKGFLLFCVCGCGWRMREKESERFEKRSINLFVLLLRQRRPWTLQGNRFRSENARVKPLLQISSAETRATSKMLLPFVNCKPKC